MRGRTWEWVHKLPGHATSTLSNPLSFHDGFSVCVCLSMCVRRWYSTTLLRSSMSSCLPSRLKIGPCKFDSSRNEMPDCTNASCRLIRPVASSSNWSSSVSFSSFLYLLVSIKDRRRFDKEQVVDLINVTDHIEEEDLLPLFN